MASGQDKGKGEGRRKKAKVEEPLTALQKGRDMAGKLLKKKSDSANLALTLQSIPYAEQLCKEMQHFSSLYEKPSCIAGDFIQFSDSFPTANMLCMPLNSRNMGMRFPQGNFT